MEEEERAAVGWVGGELRGKTEVGVAQRDGWLCQAGAGRAVQARSLCARVCACVVGEGY